MSKSKIPPLTKGSDYRGAQIGRQSLVPSVNVGKPIKMRMVRLRWVDGDYDQAGAYWGRITGTHIFRAISEEEFPLMFTTKYSTGTVGRAEVFVRARNRKTAKELVRTWIPTATFFR